MGRRGKADDAHLWRGAQSYPEFCRRLYDTAGPAFVQASQRWQEKFGKVIRASCRSL